MNDEHGEVKYELVSRKYEFELDTLNSSISTELFDHGRRKNHKHTYIF